MNKKQLVTVISVIVVGLLIVTGVIAKNYVKSSVKEIFQLNEELKSEGYYLVEFETKMLGCAYYLDKGQYLTAFSRLYQIHRQLKTKEGLIKVPEFADKKAKLNFYLNLQNPRTGAFMDDTYPLFTYIGGTLNLIAYLEFLSQEVGEPLRLKYPLHFLDQINTPEKLTVFLNDLSSVGRIGANFRTPYVEAAEFAEAISDTGILSQTGLYTFSPEWKNTLLQWFYNNQDSKTGYWGPKLKGSGELLNAGDLVSTEKILKLFVDFQGNNLHTEFPLQYRDELFSSTLQKISEPMPADLAEQHEWGLIINHGTRLLTRYLWSSASVENKNKARILSEKILRNKFQQFYIEQDGAFSLYAGAEHADLDGTGETLGYLDHVGALSSEKQELLWGPPAENFKDLGVYKISKLTDQNLAVLTNTPGLNSLRFYQSDSAFGNYSTGVIHLNYPKDTPVLDVLDLLPKTTRWVKTTSQNMGNWVTKEEILQRELKNVKTQAIPVSKGELPQQLLTEVLQKNGKLIIIGFDVLQIPRFKLTVILN